MFFDNHVHIGTNKIMGRIKYQNKQLPGYLGVHENEWNKYLKSALKNRVYKALIFPFTFKEVDFSRANNYISQAYDKNQELFIPFFIINEHLSPKELEGQTLFGIKEHFYITRNIDINSYYPIYDFLQATDKFLFIHPHMNERVERIQLIKKNFPKLKIILAHSGRKWPFTGDDVLDLIIPALKSYEDVYFETSTIRDPQVISEMVKVVGSHRVLFGSDYPFDNSNEDVYKVEFEVMDRLEVSGKDRDNIIRNNFKRLFIKDVWIRRVSRDDRNDVMQLINELGPKERKFLALDQKIDVIKSNIRDERHIYVLEDSQRIIGFIRESGRSNNGAIIEELLIQEQFRGKGYAQLLMGAISKKFDYIEAKTLFENKSINNLNIKMGFDIAKQSNSGKILYWRKVNEKAT